MQPPEIDFRLYPESGHSEAHPGLPLLTHWRHASDEIYGHQAYRISVISVAPYELVSLIPDPRHPSRALVVT